MDLLLDIPIEVIFQRPIFLKSLLDVVGSLLIADEIYGNYYYFLNIFNFSIIIISCVICIQCYTDTLAYDPYKALLTLKDIYDKAIIAYKKYIDGNICATYPNFMKKKKQNGHNTSSYSDTVRPCIFTIFYHTYPTYIKQYYINIHV